MVSEKNRKLFDVNEFLKNAINGYFIEKTVAVEISCEKISFMTTMPDRSTYPMSPLWVDLKFAEGYGCEKIDRDTAREMTEYVAQRIFQNSYSLTPYNYEVEGEEARWYYRADKRYK